jgi:hypothetical protein
MDDSAADHDMDDVVSIKEEPMSGGVGPASAAGIDKVQHRKPHQKSRMGCTQCKARRVKVRLSIPFIFVSHSWMTIHTITPRGCFSSLRISMHKPSRSVDQ